MNSSKEKDRSRGRKRDRSRGRKKGRGQGQGDTEGARLLHHADLQTVVALDCGSAVMRSRATDEGCDGCGAEERN
ncbi:hypothetical protein E2C01_072601 [Portunus trituberculatus]|uniref:Uncharacterized protein n=1 Tax=Portunus trituberculatus TaxID=210409 RepID=A0A5B7I301_PORTR|nr:hypothetical protein [Portunus trituberculatus]